MRIGNLDSSQRVVVVAEIGNNHEGNTDLARRMIEAAAAAGVDAVKFQTIVPERLACSDQHDRLAQLRRFQLSRADHEKLAAAAAEAGVLFMSTPFAIEAVEWLVPLVPAFKIASGDNDFWPLIDRVAQTGKPLLISLGLGGERRAAALVEYCNDAWRRHGVANGELALLHCVSAYPTPDEAAGLSAIHRLRGLGVTIGYSDHTLGIKAAELAVAAGAQVIEKHFTLDKNQSAFRDHKLAADAADMRDLVTAVRNVERMMRRVDDADAANRIPATRSIAAARDLVAGTVLQWDDLTWLRPGNGLRPGSEAGLIGRRLRSGIAAGLIILPEHLD